MRKFYKIKNYGYRPLRLYEILKRHRFKWENHSIKFYRSYSWSEFNRNRISKKMTPISLLYYRKIFNAYTLI